jgi:hypothetical protein
MTSAQPRPRIVEVAFWCWAVAAILLVLGGLLALTTGFGNLRGHFPAEVTDDQIRSFLTFYRGTGGVCIVLGVAIGYLAGRTRRGDKRFRRASVALSFATVVLLLACAILLRIVLPLAPLAAIALIAAAVSATRERATAWFDAMDSRGDSA